MPRMQVKVVSNEAASAWSGARCLTANRAGPTLGHVGNGGGPKEARKRANKTAHLLGVVQHTFHTSTWEAEAGRLQI
jgi:hypothetical protein